jgi:hypothetical protein
MRHAARRDDAEGPIVDVLERLGLVVVRLSQANIPDLLVGVRGKWVLLEVKSEDGELRRGQETFCRIAWAAHLPVAIVRTPDDALKALGFERWEEGR